MKKNTGIWKQIYIEQLKTFGGTFIFECNIKYEDANNIHKHKFINSILTAWSKINFTESNVIISKQVLWNNSHIKNEAKTLFLQKTGMIKGIQHIEHIF